MAKKYSRRSFLKQSLTFLFSLLGLSGGGYAYARFIEPSRLQLNEVEIQHERIPKSFNNLKIVQFSDTHLGFQYSLKQLEKHISLINSLNPDMIFFTGDLLDKPNEYESSKARETVRILQELHAPLGKFSVYGNHDHGGYGTDLYQNMMKQSGFTLLKNESAEIYKDEESIFLLGIDDAMLGKPSIGLAKQRVKENHYQILLSHAPDLADEAAGSGIHLQLSGHSHGGQIQLPFVGTLITPPFAERYQEGRYDLSPLTLYVNRGLGTTRLPFRFLSVPEITIFTLQTKQKT
ncbi:putative MPP superfamily phosphohydrolase [Bacillus ectoiniformans]|uniref:metallophosphoesterase n=1 Tax=Bacillus ectoiniformans TaxID=1494429 RepID=UPI0019596A20|nr:metallophosphoesterase [Bacillus ectoiniformans]MBM7647304.1 putative MPP superfamily phosphohydrolase [Bacillus ectoiniformans]